MYRAFNIKLSFGDSKNLDKYVYENYDEEKRNCKLKLNKLINSNEVIEAEEIKNILMPKVKADIFISHSHKDLELAKKLAGFLKDCFGLTSFIDSLYWGNIDELLKEMDKSHYNSEERTYDHAKSQRSCRHADMILTSALTETIDKCECIFFLNTENAVPQSKDILDADKDSTYSPWIYHEVYTTTIINKKYPTRELNKRFSANESIQDSYQEKFIKYELDLSGMHELKYKDLCVWRYNKSEANATKNLDKLYELSLETKILHD